LLLNLQNVRKIFQMVIKIPTFSIPRPFKIYANLEFWFENKPPGYPDLNQCK
jgi:hypothetical protein